MSFLAQQFWIRKNEKSVRPKGESLKRKTWTFFMTSRFLHTPSSQPKAILLQAKPPKKESLQIVTPSKK